MSTLDKKIIVILGPTSSGKSDIAIKLAKKFDGEIVSADSRQIYRGMDIGTGKAKRDLGSRIVPNKSSEARFREGSRKSSGIYMSENIPHHMIDIVSPRSIYNVAKFKKQAEKIIRDILRRGKLPIICGGTGLWIQSIVDDINFPEVKPDWKLRTRLEKHSSEKLFSMLRKLDPERAENIDAKNKIRLIRAIEICRKIKTVPSIKTRYQILNTKYQTLQIGLKLPKDKLYINIERRVKSRFKQGMIQEVEKMHQQGLSWKKIQSFGLAYFWIPLYLQNNLSKNYELENCLTCHSRENGNPARLNVSGSPIRSGMTQKMRFIIQDKQELIQKVIQAEKNYAKRQMTWFKRDQRIKWLKNDKIISRIVSDFIK